MIFMVCNLPKLKLYLYRQNNNKMQAEVLADDTIV